MMPLRAEIQSEPVDADGRGAVRRTLRLPVTTVASGDVNAAIVHNLSEAGLLVETDAAVRIGETIEVDLPDASASTAIVVRRDGRLVGCQFVSPVSRGVVSAAQLMTPVAPPPPIDPPAPTEEDSSEYGGEWRYDVGHHRDDEQMSVTIVVAIAIVIALIAVIFFVSALRVPTFGQVGG
jgi:hypothetical protein